MKIFMLKGLPGSGKSTWAKQMSRNNQQYLRVNKDDIREMIGYTPSRENLVLRVRDAVIVEGLQAGKNVIVDDTNFHPKHEARLRELAAKHNAEFEEQFFNTPLEECIKNDLKRPDSVGEKVIRKMYRDFLEVKPSKPVHKTGYPHAIIVDIDGTLALHNGRSPYDAEKCGGDLPNFPVIHAVRALREAGYHVIFCSGREDKWRDITIEWLEKFGVCLVGDDVHMRRAGDFRKDDVVKQEIYDTMIKDYFNVMLVLDDRKRVVDMWRKNGLICLQVAEGEF